MRTAFLLCFAANLILTGATLLVGPPTMAIHFGAGGVPNGWASSSMNALIMTGMNLLILVSFLFVPQLMSRIPPRWINLPRKEYWLKPENRDRAIAMLSSYLFVFGTATFAFMFGIGLLVLDANRSNPVGLREDLFWGLFGPYMAFTLYWVVKMILAFRAEPSAR